MGKLLLQYMTTLKNCEKWIKTLALALLENTFPQSKDSILYNDGYKYCVPSSYEKFDDFFLYNVRYVYKQIISDKCLEEFKYIKENAKKFCENDSFDYLDEYELLYNVKEILNGIFQITQTFNFEDSKVGEIFYKNATKTLCLIIYDYQLGN